VESDRQVKKVELRTFDAQWIEQAGKGAAELGALIKIDPERAPAGLSTLTLRLSNGDLAGARSGSQLQCAQFSAAPFPACT